MNIIYIKFIIKEVLYINIGLLVNKTKFIAKEEIKYTIQTAFSSLTISSVYAKVEQFFPKNVSYILPDIGGNIESISEVEEDNGTIVVIDFGLRSTGTTFNTSFSAYFNEEASIDDTFINTATLYIDGEAYTQASANEVVCIDWNEPTITYDIKDDSIYLDQGFDPYDNVVATQYDGSDITSNISILENNVDTTTIGSYIVEYEVVDGLDYTTVLTRNIEVIELKIDGINNVIDSIAKEEEALSLILDAEASKIQKVIEENVSTEELLSVNDSVNSVVNSIINLEIILGSKISTVLGN